MDNKKVNVTSDPKISNCHHIILKDNH